MRSQVVKNLKNKEYRDAYTESFVSSSVAAQIKALREQRKWNQKELAERAGMKQPVVSRLENVNYSRWTTQTLLKLASAFDVALKVSFCSYGEQENAADSFSRVNLERPSFNDDPAFRPLGPISGAVEITDSVNDGNGALVSPTDNLLIRLVPADETDSIRVTDGTTNRPVFVGGVV